MQMSRQPHSTQRTNHYEGKGKGEDKAVEWHIINLMIDLHKEL
jgi:hypothetical protein